MIPLCMQLKQPVNCRFSGLLVVKLDTGEERFPMLMLNHICFDFYFISEKSTEVYHLIKSCFGY